MIKNKEHDLFTLRSILENLDDAVITHDLTATILNSNPAAEQMFGLSVAKMYGKSIYSLIPKELHAEYTAILKKLVQEGIASHLKTIRLNAARMPIAVSATVSPIKNEAGAVIGFSQILRDSEAERAIDEKTSILAAIIEDSEDAIISKTLSGYITSWNRGAEQIFGYTKEEVIGKHINILIPPERFDEEEVILDSIRLGNKVAHFETIRLAKSGKSIPISLTVSPVKERRGKIMGISEIARNISHKRTSEERKAILASIVENSDDAIISKTVYGIITSWNKGAEKIFGYSEQEVIGQHISIIIPPNRWEEEIEILTNIRAGITVDHFQTIRLRKDGMPLDISLTVSPIKDSNGRIVGASKVARDITSEKQAEAIIRERSKKKDEFITMASHELKTPLTSMSGYLQLLEKKVGESERIFVQKIIKQQRRLNALFNDLFDISKIQAGKLQFDFKVFDMVQLISEIVDPFGQSNPGFQFLLELPVSMDMEGDEMRLEQVMTNLLTNAIKYSPRGGEVKIVARMEQKEVVFSIQDQGLGINADDLRHIFGQFYRAAGTNITVSGLGLGLHITKEIIERHGGKIWAESEIDKGSKFTFILPIRQPINKSKIQDDSKNNHYC